MVVPNPAVATSETIAAARLLLTQMGLSPADLVAPTAAVPTFAEIVPAVRATLEAGTRGTYGTHLNHLEQQWGDRRLDHVTKPELDAMAHTIRSTALTGTRTVSMAKVSIAGPGVRMWCRTAAKASPCAGRWPAPEIGGSGGHNAIRTQDDRLA